MVAPLTRTAFQLVKQDCLLLTFKEGVHLFLLLLNFVLFDYEGHCLQLNQVVTGAYEPQKEYYDVHSTKNNSVSLLHLIQTVAQVFVIVFKGFRLSFAHNVADGKQERRGHNQGLVELVDRQEHDH